MSVSFHTKLKPSVADRPLHLLWPKSFWKRLSLPGKLLSNVIVIKELISLASCFNKSVLFGWFYNTFPVLTILNPLV